MLRISCIFYTEVYLFFYSPGEGKFLKLFVSLWPCFLLYPPSLPPFTNVVRASLGFCENEYLSRVSPGKEIERRERCPDNLDWMLTRCDQLLESSVAKVCINHFSPSEYTIFPRPEIGEEFHFGRFRSEITQRLVLQFLVINVANKSSFALHRR